MSNKQSEIEQTVATIAGALARPEPLNSAECTALLLQAGQRMVQVDMRVEAIIPGRNGRNAGQERIRILQTGTAEQIAALNAECERLEIEQSQIHAQHTALSQRREHARDEEASAGLPTMQTDFAEKIAAAEAARDTLNAALTALDAGLDKIVVARARATKAALPSAGTDPDIADRVEALSRSLDVLSQHRAVYGRIMGQDLRERLGATAFDHLLQRAGLVHPGVYFSPGTPPYDVMRRVVEIKRGSQAVEEQTFEQIEVMFEGLVAQAEHDERREAA